METQPSNNPKGPSCSMKWKILVSWPGSDGLGRDAKKQTTVDAGSPRWNTEPQRIVYWMINVMRRIHPSPQHGAQYGSFQLPLKENLPPATSQCKVSLFQQVPNTQHVRKLNARQPITMRNDQWFHPLLHLRVSNCPFPNVRSSSWYQKMPWKSNLQNHYARLGDQSHQSSSQKRRKQSKNATVKCWLHSCVCAHHLCVYIFACCEAPLLQCVAVQCPSHHKTTCGLKNREMPTTFSAKNSTTKTSRWKTYCTDSGKKLVYEIPFQLRIESQRPSYMNLFYVSLPLVPPTCTVNIPSQRQTQAFVWNCKVTKRAEKCNLKYTTCTKPTSHNRTNMDNKKHPTPQA